MSKQLEGKEHEYPRTIEYWILRIITAHCFAVKCGFGPTLWQRIRSTISIIQIHLHCIASHWNWFRLLRLLHRSSSSRVDDVAATVVAAADVVVVSVVISTIDPPS